MNILVIHRTTTTKKAKKIVRCGMLVILVLFSSACSAFDDVIKYIGVASVSALGAVGLTVCCMSGNHKAETLREETNRLIEKQKCEQLLKDNEERAEKQQAIETRMKIDKIRIRNESELSLVAQQGTLTKEDIQAMTARFMHKPFPHLKLARKLERSIRTLNEYACSFPDAEKNGVECESLKTTAKNLQDILRSINGQYHSELVQEARMKNEFKKEQALYKMDMAHKAKELEFKHEQVRTQQGHTEVARAYKKELEEYSQQSKAALAAVVVQNSAAQAAVLNSIDAKLDYYGNKGILNRLGRMEGTLDTVNDNVAIVNSNVGIVNNNIASIKKGIDATQRDIATVKKGINETSQSVATVAADIADMKDDVEGTKEQINWLGGGGGGQSPSAPSPY